MPAMQLAHVPDPELSWYWPAAHAAHDPALAIEYRPAMHAEQLDCPALAASAGPDAYRPDEQLEHSPSPETA